MAKVKLQIELKDSGGEDFKTILGYINPNCADDKLREFADSLNNLTTNRVVDVFKIVEKFLSEVAPDDEITAQDLLQILQGQYTPIDDQFTDNDINLILQGQYSPVDDEFTDSDFVF